MAITEKQRHHLFNTLEAALGPEDAATMMDLLPPVGWGEVATPREVESVRADLRSVEQRLTARMERLEERLDGRIDSIHEVIRSQTRWLVGTFLGTAATFSGVLGAISAFG